MPLLTGFSVSRLLADPFFEVLLKYDTNAFALSDRKKVEGAHEVHMHEMRLRMDAALGKAPPITENELQVWPSHDSRFWGAFSGIAMLKDGPTNKLRLAAVCEPFCLDVSSGGTAARGEAPG